MASLTLSVNRPLHLSVILFTVGSCMHGGHACVGEHVCMEACMHGACMANGACVAKGACMVMHGEGGCAWQKGVFVERGDMYGEGRGMHALEKNTSRQYASYWNVFLLGNVAHNNKWTWFSSTDKKWPKSKIQSISYQWKLASNNPIDTHFLLPHWREAFLKIPKLKIWIKHRLHDFTQILSVPLRPKINRAWLCKDH